MLRFNILVVFFKPHILDDGALPRRVLLVIGETELTGIVAWRVLHFEGYFDPPLAGKLEGVAHHVHQYLFDSLWVSEDLLRDVLANNLLQLNSFELALLLEQDENVVQKLSHVEIFIDEAELLVVVKFGEVLDILNHREYEFEAQIKVFPIGQEFWHLLLKGTFEDPACSLYAVKRRLQIMDNRGQLQ
jgi:hypothetical protein